MESNERTCGNCFWFTEMSNRRVAYDYKNYDHYCKLHYAEELRHKNEKACNDWCEGGKSANQ